MPDDLLAPFRARPERAGVLTDFDGTLSPIVPDPAAARPLPEAAALLHRLADRYERVAVVSGRPAEFLVHHLGLSGGGRLYAVGLYGMEYAQGGIVTTRPDAEEWRAVVDTVAREAEEQAPFGVLVERKGLSVTLHYRTAPEEAAWARRFAEDTAGRTGLVVHPARMSDELRPPVPVDKGRVVADLCEGLEAACFIGDDVGDLPAFEALDRIAAARDLHVLKVVAGSAELPAELATAADVVVDGPAGAVAVLRALLPS